MPDDGHPLTQPSPAPLFSEETIGQMLRQLAIVEAGQRTCEEQNDIIRSELTATRVTVDRISQDLRDVQAEYRDAMERISLLAESQAEDDKARDRMHLLWVVARTIGVVFVVVVLPLVGWGLSTWWEAYTARGDAIESTATMTRQNVERLQRQEEASEAMREAVQGNTRGVDRIEERLNGIATGQQVVRDHTDEILRVLRRVRGREPQ